MMKEPPLSQEGLYPGTTMAEPSVRHAPCGGALDRAPFWADLSKKRENTLLEKEGHEAPS